MQTMTHESHGLCFCGIGSHCSGGEFCDGECRGSMVPDSGRKADQ